MSFTKTKYDTCFQDQQQEGNKSIYNYVVDSSRYINQNECNNYTPPFLTYIPSGVHPINIEMESELRGITRAASRCNDHKHQPSAGSNRPLNVFPNNKKQCAGNVNILPKGYLPSSK